MPQLDTIYILLMFLSTWLTLYLMMQKIKNLPLTNPMTYSTSNKPSLMPLWL